MEKKKHILKKKQYKKLNKFKLYQKKNYVDFGLSFKNMQNF